VSSLFAASKTLNPNRRTYWLPAASSVICRRVFRVRFIWFMLALRTMESMEWDEDSPPRVGQQRQQGKACSPLSLVGSCPGVRHSRGSSSRHLCVGVSKRQPAKHKETTASATNATTLTRISCAHLLGSLEERQDVLEVCRDGGKPEIYHDLRAADRGVVGSERKCVGRRGRRGGWERVSYSHGDRAPGE
jgi:hypothetical protein